MTNQSKHRNSVPMSSCTARRSVGLLEKLLLSCDHRTTAGAKSEEEGKGAVVAASTMSDDPFAWHPFVAEGPRTVPRKTVTFSGPDRVASTSSTEIVAKTSADQQGEEDNVSSSASVSSWEPIIYAQLSSSSSTGSEDDDDEDENEEVSSSKLRFSGLWEAGDDKPRRGAVVGSSTANKYTAHVGAILLLLSLSLLGKTTPPAHVATIPARSSGQNNSNATTDGGGRSSKSYLSGKLRLSPKEPRSLSIPAAARGLVPTRHVTLPLQLDGEVVQQWVDRLLRQTLRVDSVGENLHRWGAAVLRSLDGTPESQQARRSFASAVFNPAGQTLTVELFMDVVDTMMLN